MIDNIWLLSKNDVLKNLESSENGLSEDEVEKRIKKYGLNELPGRFKKRTLSLFISQFKSPLILILIVAAVIAFFLQEITDSLIILGIVFLNSFLGFIQEFKSEKALEKLTKYIKYTAKVLRNGQLIEINTKNLTIGDIVKIETGDIIPADLRLLETDELFLNESLITGESSPVKKTSRPMLKKELMPYEMKNIAFMGTSVFSGSGKGIVYAIGTNTYVGKTASYLKVEEPQGEFQINMKKFSESLIKIILIGILIIFAINSILGRNVFTSFLFAMALAVGIVPESLPIIITISLSKGASRMAKKGVIVKKLVSIEDLGNLDVLCCDKTGSLTENQIKLEGFVDINNKTNKKILIYGMLCNSAKVHNNTIRGDSIDVSILSYAKEHNIFIDPEYEKINEIPINYEKRKMAVVIKRKNKCLLIAKGAPESILASSSHVIFEHKKYEINKFKKKIQNTYKKLSSKGYRVIAIAAKFVSEKSDYDEADESKLTFLGFLIFSDPPKESAKEALDNFRKLGVKLKILTGDDPLVTKIIAKKIGFTPNEYERIVLGKEIERLSEEKLRKVVEEATIFARVTPEIKYKIIKALKDNGHVVGFLGDGVNDAPALRFSDVGISVENAADVAKDASDIVLTHKSLNVIANGIEDGRKTFSNITKYILNTVSANIGNMTTLGIISLFLNFLPLLPVQILLANFISDVPLLTISTDNVDKEELLKPKRWNIRYIEKFALAFGGISTIFDFITIAVLIYAVSANVNLFRTGWFLESVLSEILITFAIRTKKRFYKSKPSKLLLISSALTALITIWLVFSPFGYLFEFVYLANWLLLAILIILIAYFVLVEILKVYLI
ncbi:MAG: magnesium-translocating P-type ATPase [Candidatus Aenigmatarchaeota archaeon]